MIALSILEANSSKTEIKLFPLCATLYYTTLYYTTPYHAIPHYTPPHPTTPHHTIPYHTTLPPYHTTTHHTIYIMHTAYTPQYPTRGDIETIREYLETGSDKSISSNSLCDPASIILKSNYFEDEELTYHQKFATPCCHLFMAGLEKRNFQNSEFKYGYDTLMGVFVYGSKVLKIT